MKKKCIHCYHEFEVANQKDIIFISNIVEEFVEIQIDCPNCFEPVAFVRVRADDFIYIDW